jgi:hypothetical protein
MVFLTVPAAKVLKASLENLPSLTAVTKAHMRRFRWHLLNLSRKGSWKRPIDSRYSIHHLWDQAWSSCVAPITTLSRAIAAAMRSATILFLWAVVQSESEGEAERGNASVRFWLVRIAEIKIPRESIDNGILLPQKPLRIFLDVVVDEKAGMPPCNFKMDG